MVSVAWDGHYIIGDQPSIDEVKRLLRVEAGMAELLDQRHRLEILLKVTKEQLTAARQEKNASTTMGHRE
jgi:hypothetical protein